MLSLLYSSQEDLSEESAQTILKLLEVSPTPDITDFLNNPEEKDFYDFFFDMLIEKDIACTISTEWRWRPEDIFWKLEMYFTNRIKLIDSEWLEADESYHITYTFDDNPTALTIPFDNPDALLDSVSQPLKGRQFIAINFLEDRYSWITAPNDFDTELFCTLTGLTIEKPTPRPEIPKNFTEGYKQTEKLFFSPTIFYVDEKQVGYEMPGLKYGREEYYPDKQSGRVWRRA